MIALLRGQMGQMLLIQTFARACVWGNQEDLSLLSPSMGTPLISFQIVYRRRSIS